MADLTVDIEGMDALEAGLRQTAEGLGGPEMFGWATDTGATLLRGAKQKATVDTGQMRAGFDMAVTQQEGLTQTVIGGKMKHTVWQEEGTKPHWPPPGALEVWAKRHGTTDYLVRRAISIKGTKAVWMFRDALEENIRDIMRKLGNLIGRIISR
jgi:hypothetical protein